MTNAQPLTADVGDIAGHLSLLGLPAEVVELDGGNRAIRATTSGIPFSGFLFRNEEQKSPYLMLSAMFPDRKVDAHWANAWNNRFPLTRASITAAGEPMLTHSMILTGIDTDHLKEAISWWDLLLRIFVEELIAATS
ncbi:MAG: YbjN domain-containing protein [Alphaproteobacteria bacterium]|nr:YbjN domain-containing protein [Alphaproteobacteria bacterium]